MYRSYAMMYDLEKNHYRIIYTDVTDRGLWYIDTKIPAFTDQGMADTMLTGLTAK